MTFSNTHRFDISFLPEIDPSIQSQIDLGDFTVTDSIDLDDMILTKSIDLGDMVTGD